MIVEDRYIPSVEVLNHYVYLLSSRLEEKCYIGVRSCRCPISEDTYMGSSTCMTKEDKQNCNKIILARFNSRQEAVAYEIELHTLLDVVINPLFWNKAKQTSTGFDTTGRSMSLEEKTRRGEIQKERFKKVYIPQKEGFSLKSIKEKYRKAVQV